MFCKKIKIIPIQVIMRHDLNLVDNRQGESESIIVIRRDSWDGIGQIRRIRVGRLGIERKFVMSSIKKSFSIESTYLTTPL